MVNGRTLRPVYADSSRPARPDQGEYARSKVLQAGNLLADAQFLNDGFVAFSIGLSEVVEQAATLAHHHEKTAPGGMILLVGLEMFCQLTDPGTEDGNLDLR